MLLGQHSGWSHRCQPWLNLVLQSAYDIAIAFHHRLEADFGDISGIILLAPADFCIEHIGAFEELRLSCAWRQVTVTPESFSSSRKAKENESMNALVPL